MPDVPESHYSDTRRSLRELEITETEDRLIAAMFFMGFLLLIMLDDLLN